jgi:hypothetical protein
MLIVIGLIDRIKWHSGSPTVGVVRQLSARSSMLALGSTMNASLAWLTSLAVLVLLAGCASFSPPDEHARMRAAIAATSRETIACYVRLASEPKYAQLRERVAININAIPTDAQLRDIEKPTSDMIQLGLAWYSENQACDSATVERWGRVDPELGAVAAGWVTEITDIMQSVIKDRPSYASINARIKTLGERERADVRRYYVNLDARIRRQEADERIAAQRKSEENSQQFAAAIGTVSQVLLNTLNLAVQVLALRQAALAQTQTAYIQEVRVYRPARITTTNCFVLGHMLRCNQVSN